jgi:sphingolipid delta-4 desaturase
MGLPECHRQRRRAILREHPEVLALIGPRPATALTTAIVVSVQLAIAALLGHQAWWVALLAAVCVGAFVAHYLNVAIHEAAHNLIFHGARANKAAGILANLASVFPSAMGFRFYHILHHRFLGQRGMDADAVPQWEADLIGRGVLGKLGWVLLQPLTYAAIHPMQTKRALPLDGWLVANIVLVVGVAALMGWAFGASAVIYLTASTYLAVGPHATGAHILQEHLCFEGLNYETASYYGPINAISMNFGLHVEHHDLPGVPSARLASVRAMAPRYYEGRFAHRSRTQLLWRFLTDRRVGLDTRMLHQG